MNSDAEHWHCRCGKRYARHRKTCPTCGLHRVEDGLHCCGSDIYYCVQSGRFECPTHGGFDTCCSQPERHIPLKEFEVRVPPMFASRRNPRFAAEARRLGMQVTGHAGYEMEPQTPEQWQVWGEWRDDD